MSKKHWWWQCASPCTSGPGKFADFEKRIWCLLSRPGLRRAELGAWCCIQPNWRWRPRLASSTRQWPSTTRRCTTFQLQWASGNAHWKDQEISHCLHQHRRSWKRWWRKRQKQRIWKPLALLIHIGCGMAEQAETLPWRRGNSKRSNAEDDGRPFPASAGTKRVEGSTSSYTSSGLRIAEMHPGRRQHRENTPMPALTVGRALTVAVFLEIFSGVGNLSHSMASICQCYVLMWDITLGAEYDLRSPAKRRLIADWIRSGFILGFHLGTPCESFTRARDVRPGPPPLRSDSQPLGLPAAQLKPHDQVKVAWGNLWMRFSVWLLTLGLRFQARGTMENPARSRLWLCPPVQYLLRRNLVTWVETHYCAWGKPYKKPTGFLRVILTLPRLQHAVCQSGKRGICQYTLCKHMQLVGQNSQGQWLTNVAQPYPKKMCTAYAKDFYDHDVQTIARNFTSKLGTRWDFSFHGSRRHSQRAIQLWAMQYGTDIVLQLWATSFITKGECW